MNRVCEVARAQEVEHPVECIVVGKDGSEKRLFRFKIVVEIEATAASARSCQVVFTGNQKEGRGAVPVNTSFSQSMEGEDGFDSQP